MTDRTARDEMAWLLRRFASGRISGNEAYHKYRSLEKATTDRAVREAYPLLIWADELGNLPVTQAPEWWEEADVTRRDFARWILFLQSDREYEYPDYMCDAAGLLFVFPIVLAFLAYLDRDPFWLVTAIVSAILVGYLSSRSYRWEYRLRGIDDSSLKPFATTADFDAARRRPQLLAGRR